LNGDGTELEGILCVDKKEFLEESYEEASGDLPFDFKIYDTEELRAF